MPHLHESTPQVIADDIAWCDFITKVERLSGRDLNDVRELSIAYVAHREGQTASDYALEVVARAGEFLAC